MRGVCVLPTLNFSYELSSKCLTNASMFGACTCVFTSCLFMLYVYVMKNYRLFYRESNISTKVSGLEKVQNTRFIKANVVRKMGHDYAMINNNQLFS